MIIYVHFNDGMHTGYIPKLNRSYLLDSGLPDCYNLKKGGSKNGSSAAVSSDI